MATSVLIQDDEDAVEIPFLRSLDEFRQWAESGEFPVRGRIDYISGRIEVDMSPESLYSHGSVKIAMIFCLEGLVRAVRSGRLFSDRTRVSSPAADLSAEPDIVFVSREALRTGRVRRVRKASGTRDDYVELQGGPDLVAEIVSDGSVDKATDRLPGAYWRAGVLEYWLVDARGDELAFQVYRRSPSGYEPVPADAEGFQLSAVFGHQFRLVRRRDEEGDWEYDLEAQKSE